MHKTLLFSILLLLVSCTNEEKNNLNEIDQTKNSAIDTTSIKEELPEITFNKKMTSDELIQNFKLKSETISTKLKDLTALEANALYLKYREENNDFLRLLESKNQKLLDEFYAENRQNEIKTLSNKLKQGGLRIMEVGEGYVELRTVPDYYYSIYKNSVTEDFKHYLTLTKEEEKKLYSADAGLMISFKELGNRIISWENFLLKFPKSTLRKEVKESYVYYQMDYLFGLDNTPTTERWMEEGKPYIYEENLAEFINFIAKNPKSPTTKLVRLYLEKFSDENIREFMEKEQEKINAQFLK